MKKLAIFAVLAFALLSGKLHAQFDFNGGIWLPQIYLQDTLQGIEEIATLTEQLENMREQVQKAQEVINLTNDLYNIARDPSGIVNSMSSFQGATQQLDQAFGLPGAAEMHDLSVEMDRGAATVDQFGNTVEGFGNNDRGRNTSLASANDVLKRYYNRYEDMTSFTAAQDESLSKEIDNTINQMGGLSPSDDQAQNKARAMEQKIAALQRERMLVYDQQQAEYFNAAMADLEYKNLEKELIDNAVEENLLAARQARVDYVERVNNQDLIYQYHKEAIPEREPIVIK